MYACMYCMRIYVCACIYVYMHVCIYVCMCAYMYVYMQFSSWVLSRTGGGIVLVGRGIVLGNCPGGNVRSPLYSYSKMVNVVASKAVDDNLIKCLYRRNGFIVSEGHH